MLEKVSLEENISKRTELLFTRRHCFCPFSHLLILSKCLKFRVLVKPVQGHISL